MVFLSKVRCPPAELMWFGAELIPMQLKDPHARSFSHVELRDAMMETIRFINKLSKEAGIVGPRNVWRHVQP